MIQQYSSNESQAASFLLHIYSIYTFVRKTRSSPMSSYKVYSKISKHEGWDKTLRKILLYKQSLEL